QLAVESLVRSPAGPSSSDAREIIRAVNKHLGIVEEPLPVPPGPPAASTPGEPPAEPTPTPTPTPGEGAGVSATVEGPVRGRPVLASYGILGGGLLGLGVVGAGDGVSGVAADTAGGIVGGLAGGALGWWLGDRYDVSYADARTIGAAGTWGAIEFGF